MMQWPCFLAAVLRNWRKAQLNLFSHGYILTIVSGQNWQLRLPCNEAAITIQSTASFVQTRARYGLQRAAEWKKTKRAVLSGQRVHALILLTGKRWKSNYCNPKRCRRWELLPAGSPTISITFCSRLAAMQAWQWKSCRGIIRRKSTFRRLQKPARGPAI